MKRKPTHPLISCVCITHRRPEQLLRAIQCFDAQNYPNRELVVSYTSDDEATKYLINKLISYTKKIRIVPIVRSTTLSLGAAKNEAVAQCEGIYICNWDDDDWHQSARVSYQLNDMLDKTRFCQGSILTDILLYDESSQQSYLSLSHPWKGTLLCKKSLLLEQPFDDQDENEANSIISYLDNHRQLHHIGDAPYLYLYVYHGRNILNHQHFIDLCQKSQLLDEESNGWIQGLLDKEIQLLN